MVYFSNYLYFFLNPLLEILLLFYAPLWYRPLVSHNFAGIVFAGIGVDNLVHLALISLSKLFDQSIYDLIFLFIFAWRPNPSIINVGRHRCTGLQVDFLKSFESALICPFVLFRDWFADERHPVASAVAGTAFLSSSCIPFVVREVRFVVFAVAVLVLSSCS